MGDNISYLATIMDQNFQDLLDQINRLESLADSIPFEGLGEASPDPQASPYRSAPFPFLSAEDQRLRSQFETHIDPSK
jgi:hypothetical protein